MWYVWAELLTVCLYFWPEHIWLTAVMHSGPHREKQPHPFAVQWIVRRNQGPDAGGHFYIASHGVKIMNTADTMIAWPPWLWHGTSLPDFHPSERYPDYQQLGMAFVTPPRLATVFEKHAEAFKAARNDQPFGKVETAEDIAARVAEQAFLDEIASEIREDMESSDDSDEE